MALRGLLPIVHSFACFLSSRPNEQIYNNATERKKLIYVGSLAGLLPAGPGHSHQSVRDIALLASIPNMVVIEPLFECQVDSLLDWAVNENPYSTYLRLTSIPVEMLCNTSEMTKPKVGRGSVVLEGCDGTLVCTNPVILNEALGAAKILLADSISIKVIATPWLNRLDLDWFSSTLTKKGPLITIESHNVDFGFGTWFLSELVEYGLLHNRKAQRIGVKGFPVCGTNPEALAFHGLDKIAIAQSIRMIFKKARL
jgi:transketolase